MNETGNNPLAPLDPVSVTAYLSELEGNANSALFEFARLESAAARWIEYNLAASAAARKIHSPRASTRVAESREFSESLAKQGSEQAELFSALDSFLTSWGRASLLIFPSTRETPGPSFRRQRGRLLQRLLGVDERHLLNNRELRDAWMHFDERLDQAVATHTWGSRQRFVMTATPENSRGVLRQLEVPTLCLSYRDRSGITQRAELSAFADALRGLAIGTAWEQVSEITGKFPELVDRDLAVHEPEHLPAIKSPSNTKSGARKKAPSGEDLMPYAGLLDDKDAGLIQSAIAEATSHIDRSGW